MRSYVGLLIGVMAAWISVVACGQTTTVNPGSSDAAAPEADAGTDFNTETVCTSQTTWTRGDRGSSSMHPGVACINCHDSNQRGPAFAVAGTVFPTAHEPDNCNGAQGGVQVVITDATGKVTTLTVNAVGNFYSAADIQPPFHAKVVSGERERAMVAEQTSGDCNGCHTEQGTKSAPGRIVAP